MTRSDLDKHLKAVTDGFIADVQSQFAQCDSPATQNDLLELARLTFYALDGLRDSLMKFIDSDRA